MLRAYGSSISPAGVNGREGGCHGVVFPEFEGDLFTSESTGLPSRDGIDSTGPIWKEGLGRWGCGDSATALLWDEVGREGGPVAAEWYSPSSFNGVVVVGRGGDC